MALAMSDDRLADFLRDIQERTDEEDRRFCERVRTDLRAAQLPDLENAAILKAVRRVTSRAFIPCGAGLCVDLVQLVRECLDVS